MNVAIVGAGYVGLVTGLCLADRRHQVICVDLDAGRIAQLNRGVLPAARAGSRRAAGPVPGEALLSVDGPRRCRSTIPTLTLITVGTPLENDAISLRYRRECRRRQLASVCRALLATTLLW